MMGSSEDWDADDKDEGKTPLATARPSSALCMRCCSYYERVVGVLLPIAGLVDLCVGALSNWAWGIFVGIVSIILGCSVGYKHLAASYSPARNRSMKTAVHVLLTTAANVIMPYVLLTAIVQSIPQGKQAQWVELQRDGFPTACAPAAQNCVRLGNGTDIYAAGKSTDMKAPVLGGSRAQVLGQVKAWVDSKGGSVVFQSDNVMRATFTTLLMGFTDDVAVHVYCLADSRSELNLQSQSRLGVGDMGVNAQRLQSLITHLKISCPSPIQGVQIGELSGRRAGGPSCDAQCTG
mmetsp:Transcript_77826/g.113875  ORF Transcript_77826/g.113875 Transcript_77826/m.113875 type:complete len:292 (+) Transcript_77826:104-979(+)